MREETMREQGPGLDRGDELTQKAQPLPKRGDTSSSETPVEDRHLEPDKNEVILAARRTEHTTF